jgi:hypothetical protein
MLIIACFRKKTSSIQRPILGVKKRKACKASVTTWKGRKESTEEGWKMKAARVVGINEHAYSQWHARIPRVKDQPIGTKDLSPGRLAHDFRPHDLSSRLHFHIVSLMYTKSQRNQVTLLFLSWRLGNNHYGFFSFPSETVSECHSCGCLILRSRYRTKVFNVFWLT